MRNACRNGETLDWKTISNNVLLAGLFVAMVTAQNPSLPASGGAFELGIG